MSYSQSFPSVFDNVTPTNQVLKNLDNETKKIYQIVNEVLASDGHGHTGNGSDGAKLNASGMINTPSGNIVATTIQDAINELDSEKVAKGEFGSNVKDFGVVGDWNGTIGTDNTTAINNMIATEKTIVFPPGRYAHSGTINFAKEGIRVIGIGFVELHHTGTGRAVSFNAGELMADRLFNMHFKNFTITGNTNTTDGFFVQSCHHSIFEDIRVRNVANIPFNIKFSVCSEFNNLVYSVNEGGMTVTTDYGIVIDRRLSGENTTACIFRNPIIEGVSNYGKGIFLNYANSCTFIGGTSESCGTGLEIVEPSTGNTFISLDCEVNRYLDYNAPLASDNIFINCNYWQIGLEYKSIVGNKNILLGGNLKTDNNTINLVNDWVSKDDVIYGTPIYSKKNNGLVLMQGVICNGLGVVITQLPIGYRPSNKLYFVVGTDSTAQNFITIEQNGVVTFAGNNPTFVPLCNISFMASS